MDFGKKLYRSGSNRMLCGVCGGIGEYLNIDPTLVRLGRSLPAQGRGLWRTLWLLSSSRRTISDGNRIRENGYTL